MCNRTIGGLGDGRILAVAAVIALLFIWAVPKIEAYATSSSPRVTVYPRSWRRIPGNDEKSRNDGLAVGLQY